ncbi:hypothetical protein GIB67_006461 [Kingdonia uniflora]|uniref:Uncharacterized protein n=1 Tax=Kingdonia uniflora TaxID=39325 RepID=A0A7J7NEB7_9MAGN|nr:hypothetical protein GIB67_006461 [Kingdonia uniflora]
MRRDSGIPQQHLPWIAPNLSCAYLMPEPGWENCFQDFVLPSGHMASTNYSLQDLGGSESPLLKPRQASEQQGWFYGLPRHRQALIPAPISVPIMAMEEPKMMGTSTGQKRFLIFDHVQTPTPNSAPILPKEPNIVGTTGQKRFLIFDQSGSRTSLIFSSLAGSPVQQPSLGYLNLFNSCGVNVEAPMPNNPVDQAEAVISDGFDDNYGTDEKSEMHEDTEELNALLYSDDDYESDDEEVSTGHSPGEMTDYEKEEVASSGGPTKRKRETDQEETELLDTASSGGPIAMPQSDFETESICGEGRTQEGDGATSILSHNKRIKRKRILETVGILRRIIPGGMDKDALLVLDEAIQYVKSLKLKAKSLGENL